MATLSQLPFVLFMRVSEHVCMQDFIHRDRRMARRSAAGSHCRAAPSMYDLLAPRCVVILAAAVPPLEDVVAPVRLAG